MPGHRRIGTAGHRQTRNTKTRRRARVVGAGTAAGAFLAFGMTPLATTPSAHADDFGLGDLIANLITGGMAGLPDSVVDPSALDLSSLLDLGAFGLGADHATTLAASADALPSVSDPFAAASSQSTDAFGCLSHGRAISTTRSNASAAFSHCSCILAAWPILPPC